MIRTKLEEFRIFENLKTNQQFLLVFNISPTVPDLSWTALDVPLGPQVGPMLEASGRLGAFLADLAAI